jgi:hypothetical protein
VQLHHDDGLLATLIHKLVLIDGIEELALTSNGMLLTEQAAWDRERVLLAADALALRAREIWPLKEVSDRDQQLWPQCIDLPMASAALAPSAYGMI